MLVLKLKHVCKRGPDIRPSYIWRSWEIRRRCIPDINPILHDGITNPGVNNMVVASLKVYDELPHGK